MCVWGGGGGGGGGSLKASNQGHRDSMYSQIFFLLMSLGDERNIVKIFV